MRPYRGLSLRRPQPPRLDLASAELLACCIWSDVRPVRGTAGLLDFRLAGRLSSLLRESFVSGARGEVLMVPGRPSLPFEKVMVFGLGPRPGFSDLVCTDAVKHMSRALEQLRVVRAVVELPGRADGAVTAERVTDSSCRWSRKAPHDAWWLVEDADAQRRMAKRLQRDRRVARSA